MNVHEVVTMPSWCILVPLWRHIKALQRFFGAHGRSIGVFLVIWPVGKSGLEEQIAHLDEA